VKAHARLLLPEVFGDADEGMELWLAPGDTELRVAQNEIPLTRWSGLPDGDSMPRAAECGFDPEIRNPSEEPFAAKRDVDGQPVGARFKAQFEPPERISEFVDLPPPAA